MGKKGKPLEAFFNLMLHEKKNAPISKICPSDQF